jgi:hypothetical protein
MDVLLETTVWNTPYAVQNHIYILEGASKLVGYIPDGKNKPVFFAKPRSFDKKGRTFEKLGNYSTAKGFSL